jgi:hypothetical protein
LAPNLGKGGKGGRGDFVFSPLVLLAMWRPNLSALVRSFPLSHKTQNAGDATQVLSIYALLGRGKKYRGVIVAPPVEKPLTFVFLSLLYYYYYYYFIVPGTYVMKYTPLK